MVGGKGNGRSSDVEAEVLRARRARGAARDPGALVRREDVVRSAIAKFESDYEEDARDAFQTVQVRPVLPRSIRCRSH